jgi:hypothetical protein
LPGQAMHALQRQAGELTAGRHQLHAAIHSYVCVVRACRRVEPVAAAAAVRVQHTHQHRCAGRVSFVHKC